MGVADPIPGVSAGSIAFICKVYHRLLAAFSAFNIVFFKNFFCFRFRVCFQAIDLRFLLPLGLGLFLALILTANLIHFLLLHYFFYLWSFFFGLVAFSTIFLLKSSSWKLFQIFFLVVGIVLGYFIVGLMPIQVAGNNFLFFFFGFIAITSLLLPGISGAFVLVILGQYEIIISAVKNPFELNNFIILCYFYCGAVSSLLISSKLLYWLMKKYNFVILFFLGGLTLGSLRKIWPWKEKIFKENILLEVNKLPIFDKSTFFALVFIVFGILFAILIHKLPKIFKKNVNV